MEKAPQFTGSQSCLSCHKAEAEAWRGSDHANAMAVADDSTILGSFENDSILAFGESFRFHKKGGRHQVEIVRAGSPPETHDIAYTFGIRPLQQYLISLGKGKIQGLPVAWDTRKNRWFNLQDSAVPPDDWYHWTRGGQNWNTQCADCHSTGLRRNYVAEKDSFHTDFKEINVSCEACHGPGSNHVAWAVGEKKNPSPPTLPPARRLISGLGGGLVAPLRKESTTVQMESCAPCHSRRMPLLAVPEPGGKFLDHYQPELIRPGLYHPDGHFLEEDYEYGSFLQSKMFKNGVKCSDCHEPHGLKVRRQGNALCTECHKPETFDVPPHHRHNPGSTGASCVECHMPGKLYMQVDYRRDHSMRIPRPDLSVKLGTPNACNDCHKDKKPIWAAGWIVKWFGPDRKPHFAEAFHRGWSGLPGADSALSAIAADTAWGAIVRASALEALGAYMTGLAAAVKSSASSDPDPLVRLASARSLEGADRDTRMAALPKLLRDSVRSVRLAAANSLLDLGPVLDSAYRGSFQSVLSEQKTVFLANAYFPTTHFNAGLHHSKLGQSMEARRAYEKTLKMDNRFVPAHMNLSQLLATGGELRMAESHLRQAIQAQPGFGDAHYSLGLALAEQGILDSAAASLRRAADLMPGQSRVRYNLALSLQRLGKNGEAEAGFLDAIRLEPGSTDFHYALAVLYLQTRQREKAMKEIRVLMTISPRHPGLEQMLRAMGKAPGN